MAQKRYLRTVDFEVIMIDLAVGVVSATFSLAALSKFRDPLGAIAGVDALGFRRGSAFTGRMLPVAEAGLGIALLVPASRAIAGAAALVRLAIFSVAIARALRAGRHPVCHCFGRHARPITANVLIRNGALAALALVVATRS